MSSAATETHPCPNELVVYSQRQIQEGSKSFSFASFFFSERERQGAWLLYSWCRFVDDQIDHAPSPSQALEILTRLEEKTRDCYCRNTPVEFSSTDATAAAFAGLTWVVQEFQIPQKYPLDLLRGMRMDVQGRRYQTLSDLEEYCYCVAGVVGVMMCHIMGISREEALSNAVALGSAMQLTNICRDFDQDARLGRVYIPIQWLSEVDLNPSVSENQIPSNWFAEFQKPVHRAKWANLAQRLLAVADQRYESGVAGLTALPFRAALAVAIAARVYRQIGIKVKSRGAKAWDQRCFTRLPEKIYHATCAVFDLLIRMTPRLWRPWRPVPIKTVWPG